MICKELDSQTEPIQIYFLHTLNLKITYSLFVERKAGPPGGYCFVKVGCSAGFAEVQRYLSRG